MKVGTICKLKVDCLGNKAGTLGVVFYEYDNGFQAIFKNGNYDGFSVSAHSLTSQMQAEVVGQTEAKYFLEEVGFEESLADYQFKNVLQVATDYLRRLFDIAWSEKWQEPAEIVEKCEVFADGNRPAYLRFKRNIRADTVRCSMLSEARDFADFSHFEYADLGKSIHPRWIQANITIYPQFVVFHKKL